MNEFDQIYANGGWDGKGSGPGSTEGFTREFRGVFEKLLKERNVKSVFDLGCGDWQWQRHVEWGETKYVGWDICEMAVENAKCASFAKKPDWKHRWFITEDAFSQPLWPEADLLLVKDVVHHISRFKARMLVERAKLYSYVLWIVDLDESGRVVNWPEKHFTRTEPGKLIYAFDLSVESYRYGPKATFLQTNP